MSPSAPPRTPARYDCVIARGWIGVHETSLLNVEAGRVRRRFRPGLLLIGDAAHVMSPVAGVGINYAIQDAIVASNRLGPRLLGKHLQLADLAAVLRRRRDPREGSKRWVRGDPCVGPRSGGETD